LVALQKFAVQLCQNDGAKKLCPAVPRFITFAASVVVFGKEKSSLEANQDHDLAGLDVAMHARLCQQFFGRVSDSNGLSTIYSGSICALSSRKCDPDLMLSCCRCLWDACSVASEWLHCCSSEVRWWRLNARLE